MHDEFEEILIVRCIYTGGYQKGCLWISGVCHGMNMHICGNGEEHGK